MPVEPITLYEAYCDLNCDDDGNELCDWSWVCGQLQDSGDAEIELIIHMKSAHGVDRALPYGYEYRSADLARRLAELPEQPQ